MNDDYVCHHQPAWHREQIQCHEYLRRQQAEALKKERELQEKTQQENEVSAYYVYDDQLQHTSQQKNSILRSYNNLSKRKKRQ